MERLRRWASPERSSDLLAGSLAGLPPKGEGMRCRVVHAEWAGMPLEDLD